MTRIFLDFQSEQDLLGQGGQVLDRDLSDNCQLLTLNSEISHHLRDVLRLNTGQQINVVNKANGEEFLALIATCNKDSPLEIQLIRKLDKLNRFPVISTLACGLPKGAHSDQICEQVSQLGIERLVFWCADRSVAQPKQAANKLERWRKISEASARQSKQNRIPEVLFFNKTAELLSWLDRNSSKDKDFLGICSLLPKAKEFSCFQEPTANASLLVGPEGDFSPEEYSAFDIMNAKHISLGPLVLRVETAAVVAVSMALARWGWR